MQESLQFLSDIINRTYQKYKKEFNSHLREVDDTLRNMTVDLRKIGIIDNRTKIKDSEKIPTEEDMNKPQMPEQKHVVFTKYHLIARDYTKQFQTGELSLEQIPLIQDYFRFIQHYMKDILIETEKGTVRFVEHATKQASTIKSEIRKANLLCTYKPENQIQGELIQYLIERFKMDLRSKKGDTDNIIVKEEFTEYAEEINYIIKNRLQIKEGKSLSNEVRKVERKAIKKFGHILTDQFAKEVPNTNIWNENEKLGYMEFLLDMNLDNHILNHKTYLKLGIRPSKDYAKKQYIHEINNLINKVGKSSINVLQMINKEYKILSSIAYNYQTTWEKIKQYFKNYFLEEENKISFYGYDNNLNRIQISMHSEFSKLNKTITDWKGQISDFKIKEPEKLLTDKRNFIRTYVTGLENHIKTAQEIMLDNVYKDRKSNRTYTGNRDYAHWLIDKPKALRKIQRRIVIIELDFQSIIDYTE